MLMYIIGKGKDYYDSCASLGIDKTLIYKRDLITHEHSSMASDICSRYLTANEGTWRKYYKTAIYEMYTRYRERGYYGLYIEVIGFCGKLYPFIHYRYEEKRKDYPWGSTTKNEVFYPCDFDLLKTKVEENVYLNHCFEKQTKNKKSSWELLLDNVNLIWEQQWLDPFVQLNTPIFYTGLTPKEGSQPPLFVNANLQQMNFQRVKDPYTAWQEISMFLGGVIPRQVPETVEISDKDRIAGHGYDKWSFRKKVR